MEEKVVGRFTVAAVPNKPTAKRTEFSGKANGLVGSGSLKGRQGESKAVERRPTFSSDTNGNETYGAGSNSTGLSESSKSLDYGTSVGGTGKVTTSKSEDVGVLEIGRFKIHSSTTPAIAAKSSKTSPPPPLPPTTANSISQVNLSQVFQTSAASPCRKPTTLAGKPVKVNLLYLSRATLTLAGSPCQRPAIAIIMSTVVISIVDRRK